MIVCAKLNRLEKAVGIMETVLNNKGSWNFGYKNFFEYTVILINIKTNLLIC